MNPSRKPRSADPRPSSPTKPFTNQPSKAAPSQEQIRQKAYEIWLANGKQPGQEQAHWLEAERQLRKN